MQSAHERRAGADSGADTRRDRSLTIGSEFKFRPGLAGDKDPGVTVGQNVTSALVFGKPTTVIDMSTDSEGRSRFTVQVTVTKVAVE